MPHKLRKIRKKRGSRVVGYGRVGQHRAVGQRGGHGKAGRRKGKSSWVLRYEPDYFEKRGFKPHRRTNTNAINVGELDEQIDQLLGMGKAVKRNDGVHVNLAELGIDKLLGSGQATHPLIIKASSFSEIAARKIKEAKGKILKAKSEAA